MKKQLEAEAHILDRVMYMLDEGSVRHLMQGDKQLADYIDELYSTLHGKYQHLVQAAG